MNSQARNDRDADKLVRWPQNKVRWLVYIYLVGLVFGLYLMFLHEWLLAWDWPRLGKILFVTLFVPVVVCAIGVLWNRWTNRRT